MPYKAFKKGDKFAVHKIDDKDMPMGAALGMHDTMDAATKQVAALYVQEKKKPKPAAESVRLEEREFSADQREKLAGKGAAMEDGSFPIATRQDLQNAVQAIGRAKNPEAAKAHIKKRARAMGLTDLLPEKWRESDGDLRTGYFRELVNLAESNLDDAEFIAKGVTIIKPGFSNNMDRVIRHPRYYPHKTLTEAVKVFEGTSAFANHPRRDDEENLPERDIRDKVGYYSDVRQSDSGALVGDLHIVGEARQWLWPMIQETKRKPDYVEVSINAIGQTRLGEAEGRKAAVVESIVISKSADIVTRGAAGGSFAGALLASDGDDMTRDLLAAMTYEEWREANPAHLKQLKREWQSARDSKALETAQTELESTRLQLTALQESNQADQAALEKYRRAELADRLLSESALPHRLREAIRADLLSQDEAGMKTIIERERVKHIAAPKTPPPVSGAGRRTETRSAQGVTTAPVFEALGIRDARLVPLPNETPEQWRKRIDNL